MVELHSWVTHFMQNVEALEWLRPSNLEKAADLICVYIGPKCLVPSSSGRTRMQPRIMVSAPAASGSHATPSEVRPLRIPSQAGTSWDILSWLIISHRNYNRCIL